MDEKLGRMVTRVVLPRVVMHSRYHYAVFSWEQPIQNTSIFFFTVFSCKRIQHMTEVTCLQAFSGNFSGLELEDGGGRGTSGLYRLIEH